MGPGRAAFAGNGGTPRGQGPARSTARKIRTQSRRPISTQSWVLRRSAMLMASHMPIAVKATVKAKAAILASMR